MTRTVSEWIGRTDNSKPPLRVQMRLYTKHNGKCPQCDRLLERSKWACDHIVALINGGENRESNLQPLCNSPCHSDKTKSDVAEKSAVARKMAKDLGLRPTQRQKIKSAGFRKASPQRSASRPLQRKRS